MPFDSSIKNWPEIDSVENHGCIPELEVALGRFCYRGSNLIFYANAIFQNHPLFRHFIDMALGGISADEQSPEMIRQPLGRHIMTKLRFDLGAITYDAKSTLQRLQEEVTNDPVVRQVIGAIKETAQRREAIIKAIGSEHSHLFLRRIEEAFVQHPHLTANAKHFGQASENLQEVWRIHNMSFSDYQTH